MELKRAVITGLGAISPIGTGINEINTSLLNGKSGISINTEYKEMGMKSEISGSINLNLSELIDRKMFRFMGETAKILNPDKKIFWSGYTNGWLGYLPTARAYEEGGYETRNTPLSPESEELILDICDSEIKKFD